MKAHKVYQTKAQLRNRLIEGIARRVVATKDDE